MSNKIEAIGYISCTHKPTDKITYTRFNLYSKCKFCGLGIAKSKDGETIPETDGDRWGVFQPDTPDYENSIYNDKIIKSIVINKVGAVEIEHLDGRKQLLKVGDIKEGMILELKGTTIHGNWDVVSNVGIGSAFLPRFGNELDPHILALMAIMNYYKVGDTTYYPTDEDVLRSTRISYEK